MLIAIDYFKTKESHKEYYPWDFNYYTEVELDHDTNTCSFKNTDMWMETIFVNYPKKSDSTCGSWSDVDNRISIMQGEKGRCMTIDTVSHEVAHLVSDFMAQQPDIDSHFGPYMQGYFTQCVYDIMMHDIEDS